MIETNTPMANFIIGGTEKAGTTSVFTYLAAHPEVCASHIKETDFFRKNYTSKPDQDRHTYSNFFTNCKLASQRIIMEASPGYLGEAEIVPERIYKLIPDVKILFILRDPIDRLYSLYNFHVGKLKIPENVSFAKYVDNCLLYAEHKGHTTDIDLEEWYLKSLEYGNYGLRLQKFYEIFPADNIKILFFEDLCVDPLSFVYSICDFLDIDKTFYETYEFNRVNVTFSSRLKFIHKVAMKVNDITEQHLRRHPTLKKNLVAIYKIINQAQEGYEPMQPHVRDKLKIYYADSNKKIKTAFDQ